MPLVLIAPALCLAGEVWCQQSLTPDAVHDMQGKQQDFVLVDVRSPNDFQAQHIQGAINIPGTLLHKARLPKNKPLVLYCGNSACQAGHIAAKALAADGYDRVMVLDGGLAAWQSKSYPISAAPPADAAKTLPVKRISARELNGQLGKKPFVILDVRPPAEFRSGRLPGAVNIPFEDLPSKSAGLDQAKPVIVYDRIPQRSRQAAQLLQSGGFKVWELSGGISVWAAMKFPIEVQDHK